MIPYSRKGGYRSLFDERDNTQICRLGVTTTCKKKILRFSIKRVLFPVCVCGICVYFRCLSDDTNDKYYKKFMTRLRPSRHSSVQQK